MIPRLIFTNIQKMKCIWKHSIATSWGIIALKQIVANMHVWASRILRPKVSEFISLCRKERAHGSIPPASIAQIGRKNKRNKSTAKLRQSTSSQAGSIPTAQGKQGDSLNPASPPSESWTFRESNQVSCMTCIVFTAS